MYLLIHGTVEVLSGGAVGGGRVCLLEDGAYFGELALIGNVQRSSTVVTLTPAEICSLSSASLAAVLDDFPDVEPLLRERAMKRIAAMGTGAASHSKSTLGETSEVDKHSLMHSLAPLLGATGSGSNTSGGAGQAAEQQRQQAQPPLSRSVFARNRRRSLVSVVEQGEAAAATPA